MAITDFVRVVTVAAKVWDGVLTCLIACVIGVEADGRWSDGASGVALKASIQFSLWGLVLELPPIIFSQRKNILQATTNAMSNMHASLCQPHTYRTCPTYLRTSAASLLHVKCVLPRRKAFACLPHAYRMPTPAYALPTPCLPHAYPMPTA